MPDSANWREALSPPYAFRFAYGFRASMDVCSSDDIDLIIRFIADESIGLGHGRMRATLCRELKRHPLSSGQKRRLGDAVGRRLLSGRFSQHFFCQLRSLARIDYERLRYWCERGVADSGRPHVQRFARRALQLPAMVPERAAKTTRAASPRRRRPRWVPTAAREEKAAADAAGRALYQAICSSFSAAREWRACRRGGRTDRFGRPDGLSDPALVSATAQLHQARTRFAAANRRPIADLESLMKRNLKPASN